MSTTQKSPLTTSPESERSAFITAPNPEESSSTTSPELEQLTPIIPSQAERSASITVPQSKESPSNTSPNSEQSASVTTPQPEESASIPSLRAEQSAPVIPSGPRYQEALQYRRLQNLQRLARESNSLNSHTRRSAAANFWLQNAWQSYVDEVITILNQSLNICQRCRVIHTCPETIKMMTSLRFDMDHAEVGQIDETMIGEGDNAFGEIVRIQGKDMLSVVHPRDLHLSLLRTPLPYY